MPQGRLTTSEESNRRWLRKIPVPETFAGTILRIIGTTAILVAVALFFMVFMPGLEHIRRGDDELLGAYVIDALTSIGAPFGFGLLCLAAGQIADAMITTARCTLALQQSVETEAHARARARAALAPEQSTDHRPAAAG